MKLKTFASGVVLASLISTAAPVFAHHSFEAEFDRAKQVTLTGTVTKVALVETVPAAAPSKPPETTKPNGSGPREHTASTITAGKFVDASAAYQIPHNMVRNQTCGLTPTSRNRNLPLNSIPT